MDIKALKRNNYELNGLAAEVLNRIKNNRNFLSAKQKIFAEFVSRNPERIGFLSIMEAAKETGISQTTIFRFCKVLGYDGYSQFTRELQQALQLRMSVSKTFQLSLTHYERKEGPQSIFESVVQQEIENISNLTKSISKEDYYNFIDLMTKADKIAVVGFMASAPLAVHFGNMLSKIDLNIDVVYDHSIKSASTISKLTKKSIVFLIAFPRYPRNTIEIAKVMSHKGAQIVSMTNTYKSPLVHFSKISFIVPLNFRSFADPYAAPITLITAFCTELSSRVPKRAKKGLSHYDNYVSEFNLFL